jgi:signal peptidase I
MNEEIQPTPTPAADALPEAPPPPPARPARERTTFREYLESLLVTVILVLYGTSFVVQAFKIPSQSMEPTLLVGDHLLVNKFLFGGRGAWYDRVLPYRDVERGDIIVFKYPFDDHPHYVKRVIGLPGDRLRIVDRQVWINGEPLDEPYKVHSEPRSYDDFGDNFPPRSTGYLRPNLRSDWAREIVEHVDRGELVVPPGKYFALGDNRDSSQDSRYWGFVDRESIMGRPILIYWSIDSTSEEYADRSIGGRLIGLANTIVHLPRKTRWDRVFQPVR